ncbi:MAG: hypothetical protein KFKLKKLM_01271 [Flavobacteriales bacterium]|nr:hypothetical protein [Flavobacteriales bacterium]
MYKYLIGFFMVLSFSVIAQKTSYKTVDSVSFYLYENKMWDNLKDYGKLAKKMGYDYHYLNLRTGIAFYESEQYLKAEKHLKKAQKQNPSSVVAAEYLYVSALKNGNTLLAGSLHSSVTNDSIKFTRSISTISLESGIKLSADKSVAGDVNYYSVGIGHLPSKKVAFFQSYLFQNQNNNIWGNYKQHQYYLGTSVYLGNNWSVDVGSHLHQYQSVIDFKYDSTETKTTPPQFAGDYKIDSSYIKHTLLKSDYKQQGAYFYLGFTKRKGGFKFSPFFQLNLETNNSTILETKWVEENLVKLKPGFKDQQVFNKDTTISNFEVPSNIQNKLIGFNVEFATRKEKLKLGFTFYQPIGKERVRGTFSPYLKLDFSRIHFYLSYFKKANIGFSEYYGSVLVNTYDNIRHRINFKTTYHFTPKINLGLLYQFENKTDALSLYNYSSNMLSLSIQLKF